MNPTITHNSDEQTFYATLQGYESELAYSRPTDDVIDFTHTFVDEHLRGKGIGEQLAKTALDFARDQHLRVRTSCSFMRGFVEQHPEYQELREKK
ncbi:GNAT family N-acetyltransferase [Hymenobacter persicinus]|uniref:N-acetyltransferase n=1 Tax=Hymenobacter persicinus TaxID=2025506 RepID=A0A4Q5LDB7_9BACT|nr:GNAT family N-acetyltransferase [Hymenobacter persicinus]RYU79566.1 N-acetyltransferase [Hymenobacter persicinus]